MLSCTFASPALGPVRLNFCCLLRIVQRLLILFEGCICAGAIRIEDMISGIEFDCLGEFVTVSKSVKGRRVLPGPPRYLHSKLEVFSGESLIALSLQGVRHGGFCVVRGSLELQVVTNIPNGGWVESGGWI